MIKHFASCLAIKVRLYNITRLNYVHDHCTYFISDASKLCASILHFICDSMHNTLMYQTFCSALVVDCQFDNCIFVKCYVS